MKQFAEYFVFNIDFVIPCSSSNPSFSAPTDQLPVPWDATPALSSFFTHTPQRNTELCYPTDPQEYSDPTSKDLFTDHQTDDCKMVPTSYSTVFSISLQQAPPQRCARGFEMTEHEMVLPHRTSGHQVPF